MRGSIRILIAWLVATLVAVVIATAAVGSVRSQVTEAPTPLSSSEASALVTVTLSQPPDGESSVPSTSPTTTTPSVSESVTTTTTDTSVSTTTTEATTGTVPSTTVPPTTTTAPPATYTKTIDTTAGSINVIVDGTKVTFGGAFPNPGWSVDLEDGGPETVKVKFEKNRDEGHLEVTVRFAEGELKIDIDEHGSHSDD